MYRVDFIYYSVEQRTFIKDGFEVVDNYGEFLTWLSDNDIINYQIENIIVYED